MTEDVRSTWWRSRNASRSRRSRRGPAWAIDASPASTDARRCSSRQVSMADEEGVRRGARRSGCDARRWRVRLRPDRQFVVAALDEDDAERSRSTTRRCAVGATTRSARPPATSSPRHTRSTTSRGRRCAGTTSRSPTPIRMATRPTGCCRRKAGRPDLPRLPPDQLDVLAEELRQNRGQPSTWTRVGDERGRYGTHSAGRVTTAVTRPPCSLTVPDRGTVKGCRAA